MPTILKAKCLLFDLDSTLIDTTEGVEAHWRAIAKEHNLDAELILKTSHGRPSLETMMDHMPDKATPELARFYEMRLADQAEGVKLLPGVKELMESLKAQGIQYAICTSALDYMANKRLEQTKLEIPKVLITADKVTKGKPDPEGYTAAGRLLGYSGRDCIVIEDASAGVKAGIAAGMQCLGLLTTHTVEQMRAAGAHHIVKDLASVQAHRTDDGVELVIQRDSLTAAMDVDMKEGSLVTDVQGINGHRAKSPELDAKPHQNDTTANHEAESPIPEVHRSEESGGETEYEVEELLDCKTNKKTGQKTYLVKWLNYPLSEASWEPEETLLEDCPEFVKEYWEKKGKKSKTQSKKRTSPAARPREKTKSPRLEKASKEQDVIAGAPKLPIISHDWEKDIEEIVTVAEDTNHRLDGRYLVYVLWKDGTKSVHSNNTINKNAPFKMIKFYEQHIKFKGRDTEAQEDGSLTDHKSPEKNEGKDEQMA
ncbi:hypothetical protein BZG36_04232, partial [Bifiguratus adelaidae]